MNTATTIKLPPPKGTVFDTPIFYRSPAFECRRDESGSVLAEIFDARRFAMNFDALLDDVFSKLMPMIELAKTLPIHPCHNKKRNYVCMDMGEHPSLEFSIWNPMAVTDPAESEARMRDVAKRLVDGPTASYAREILT